MSSQTPLLEMKGFRAGDGTPEMSSLFMFETLPHLLLGICKVLKEYLGFSLLSETVISEAINAPGERMPHLKKKCSLWVQYWFLYSKDKQDHLR